MAVKISKFLKPEHIKLELQCSERTDAIREVAEQLFEHHDVKDFETFYGELLARERVESTCLGNEVAFPHARTDAVSNMVLAIGRHPKGVWFENCNQNVRFLFVIGTPKRMVTDYLTVVGFLARLLRNTEFRETLSKTQSPQDFYNILTEAEANAGHLV